MIEEWRTIPGHALYDASSFGRIRSWAVRGWPNLRAKTPKIRCLYKEKDGHLSITLGRNGRHVGVHTLIALAFHGPRGTGQVCRHLNGIPNDNRPDNLTWGTPRENSQDARNHRAFPHGSNHSNAKLNDEAVCIIRTSTETVSALARRFQVSRRAITHARSGQTWSHVTKAVNALVAGSVTHLIVGNQAFCETPSAVEALDKVTQSAFREVACTACLQYAVIATEQRTKMLRGLLHLRRVIAKTEALQQNCQQEATA